MKTFRTSIIAAFLCALAAVTLTANVKNGEIAPAFQLLDAHGNQHSLEQYRGKYVVLEWTNHQCPFVKKFYADGHMQGWQKSFTDKEVIWLSIVSSAEGKQGHLTQEQAQSLEKAQNEHATAKLLDSSGKVGRAYGAKTTPHMFIIDPQGVIIYQGAIDSIRSANSADIEKADNYVVNALDAALADKPIAVARSRPYGCSVKY